MIVRFGKRNVFMDIDSIVPGDDFYEVLERTVAACSIVFAVIGAKWVGDPSTASRLPDPNDWVRLEIEAALKRNIRVIPVLVDGARMPRASELPEMLVPLTRRQAYELRDNSFSADAERLITIIQSLPKQRPVWRPVWVAQITTVLSRIGVTGFEKSVAILRACRLPHTL
jgi:hypothetical protein